MANTFSFRSWTALLTAGALLSMSLFSAGLAFADTDLPSEVDNVEAYPGDGQITLTWDPATDNTGVAGYYVYSGLTSVTENGGSYTFGSSDVGNVTSYVMSGLSNGVTYYFAVTAYDSSGNESEFYSYETEATPSASETGDFTEPIVTDAEAMTSTLVEVNFSEDIELPSNASSAFSIVASNGDALEVFDAYLAEDASVVFVVTDSQIGGREYVLTASIGIMDTAGNPIVSGTSDTAVFSGSSLDSLSGDDEDQDHEDEEEDAHEDHEDDDHDDHDLTDADDSGETPIVTTGFGINVLQATDLDEIYITFTEGVENLSADQFTIQLAEDASVSVQIYDLLHDVQDDTRITLITDEMDAGYEYVLSVDADLMSKSNTQIDSDSISADFTAPVLDLSDLIAPEDVTNLLSSALDENSALIEWTASANTAGDLAEYFLYKSTDGVSFSDLAELGSGATDYEVSGLTAGATYTFKVTAVDDSGNESEGMFTTVTLPESGPAAMAMIGLSLAGAGALTRRRKED